MKNYNFPLLIAEDNADEVMLLRRVLTQTGTLNPVHIVNDGQEAIEYLSGDGKYADRELFPLPRLMITDIKMPRRNGLEVLQWLHNHPELKTVPALVLTNSSQPSDIKEAFRWGAHGYFIKPMTSEELKSMFQLIHNYWFLSRTPEQEWMPS
ncbi:MAG: response regulator [Verrucomicrobiota bacterium]